MKLTPEQTIGDDYSKRDRLNSDNLKRIGKHINSNNALFQGLGAEAWLETSPARLCFSFKKSRDLDDRLKGLEKVAKQNCLVKIGEERESVGGVTVDYQQAIRHSYLLGQDFIYDEEKGIYFARDHMKYDRVKSIDEKYGISLEVGDDCVLLTPNLVNHNTNDAKTIFDSLSESNEEQGLGISRPPTFEEWRNIYFWTELNDGDLNRQMKNIHGDLIISEKGDAYSLAGIRDEPEKERITPNVKEFPTPYMFTQVLREAIEADKEKL
ncbi:hypothetical protein HOE04_00255 [archaeon]|jgi:hypothetical protein|nr:hypothetical protein [archaeon]